MNHIFLIALLLVPGACTDTEGEELRTESKSVKTSDVECVECYIDLSCPDPDRQECIDNDCVDVDSWVSLRIEDIYQLNLKGTDTILELTFIDLDTVSIELDLWEPGVPEDLHGYYEGVVGLEPITESRGHVYAGLRRNDSHVLEVDFNFFIRGGYIK